MTKKFFCLFLIINIISYQKSFADTCEGSVSCRVSQEVTSMGAIDATKTTTTPTSSPTTSQRGSVTTGSTPSSMTMGGGGSGAYQQAQQAKDKADDTKTAAMMIAAAAMAACPMAPAACMLAAAGIAVAGMAGGKKDDAQNLMNQLGSGGGVGAAAAAKPDTAGTGGAAGTTADQLNALKKQLAANGYNVGDNGSITTPNGTSMTASGMTPAALKAAGLSDKDINGLLKGIDKIKQKADELSAARGIPAGGSGRTSVASTDGSETINPANKAAPESKAVDRGPAAWNGVFRQYGDSLVGVANADIFAMVESRVEQERKQMGH